MRFTRFNKTAAVLAFAVAVACITAFAQTQTQPPAQTQSKPPQQTVAKPKSQAQAPQAQSQPPQKAAALYSGIGSAPTQAEMGNLVLAAGFSGKDLPAGSGTAKQGAPIFTAQCAMCHGENLEGVHWEPGTFSPIHGPRLGGANSTPTFDRKPDQITDIAYTAPSPMVIFDTVAVEMPMFRAGTLKPDQVYALTAFILYKNGIIKEDQLMNRTTLPEVQMPDRKAFPDSDDVYMDMKKRGCWKTYGVCVGN